MKNGAAQVEQGLLLSALSIGVHPSGRGRRRGSGPLRRRGLGYPGFCCLRQDTVSAGARRLGVRSPPAPFEAGSSCPPRLARCSLRREKTSSCGERRRALPSAAGRWPSLRAGPSCLRLEGRTRCPDSAQAGSRGLPSVGWHARSSDSAGRTGRVV